MYTDREASDENDTEHSYLKFAMDKKTNKNNLRFDQCFVYVSRSDTQVNTPALNILRKS